MPVDIFAGDTLTDEFARLNPVRETPVLELDGGELITQSNAILWYLAEGTSYLPESPLERAHVVQWLAFEQDHVMAGIGGARFRRLTDREPLDPDGVASRFALGEEALRVLEQHLTGRRVLVGDRLSIADISTFAYTHMAEDAGYELAGYPSVSAWLERVRGEPAFVDDLVPYGENARPGAGRSTYD